MPVGSFKLFAHRGARIMAPENTLAAIENAQAEGADGIELDVQLTADGQPFLFHDKTGERVAGTKAELRTLTWKEIRDLRAFGKHPIPHLDDALAAMEGWRGSLLFLDLHQRSEELAVAVAGSVSASPVRERTCILDFYSNRRFLTLAARAAPDIQIAVMPGSPWNTDASAALGAAALCLGWDGPFTKTLYKAACRVYDVRPALERCRQMGLGLSAGVANTPEEIRYFFSQGFDAFWTDDLRMARLAAQAL
ncbi:MAG: glycerophosphodiester phosphodiesterase family protein [Elusimicrobia bacterium]|nr:glycerophosphodiester phosphodiesterase family protein [Elusimicrobiota bacterium]